MRYWKLTMLIVQPILMLLTILLLLNEFDRIHLTTFRDNNGFRFAFLSYCILGALQIIDSVINLVLFKRYLFYQHRKWHFYYLLLLLICLLLFQKVFLFILLITSLIAAFMVYIQIFKEYIELNISTK